MWSIIAYTLLLPPIQSLEFSGKARLLLSILINYVVVNQTECDEATRKILGLVQKSTFSRA